MFLFVFLFFVFLLTIDEWTTQSRQTLRYMQTDTEIHAQKHTRTERERGKKASTLTNARKKHREIEAHTLKHWRSHSLTDSLSFSLFLSFSLSLSLSGPCSSGGLSLTSDVTQWRRRGGCGALSVAVLFFQLCCRAALSIARCDGVCVCVCVCVCLSVCVSVCVCV